MMKNSPLQPSKPKVCKPTFETVQRVSDWSACGRRRYRLGRFWTNGPIACVIGLNPSVANAHADDPTNRRLISLLGDLGFGGYWLVNLIAESTPYPDRLGRHSRRLSMVNRQVIEQAIGESDQTILAWGLEACVVTSATGWFDPFMNLNALEALRTANQNIHSICRTVPSFIVFLDMRIRMKTKSRLGCVAGSLDTRFRMQNLRRFHEVWHRGKAWPSVAPDALDAAHLDVDRSHQCDL